MSADREHPFLGQAQRDAGGPGRLGLGLGRGHAFGPLDAVFVSGADRSGTRRRAAELGWAVPDSPGPLDDVVDALVASLPVHRDDDHHARHLVAAPDGSALAFDVALGTSSGWFVEWAVTALALPAPAPVLRVTPARLSLVGPFRWRRVDSGDDELDARWRVLAGDDDPRAERFARDPDVRAALLGTDDGDDLWTAAGMLAAIRPDGHRPALLDHHLQLLGVLQRSLSRSPEL
ncbi:hypothetical protein GB931_04050 [Modestobacter sp. I12A-02628]|uniref:Uncharacterized protein n=1 Tax=Goekera deserti TaxID=2497753 RepID=A0A7K3WIR9_9ACTN|nr:hypothetical protein [Goekera deserti]MPQ97111.1 hypothetical protein [Goekera deserti]NDI46571.1 hypothetical protein [Goekera deserti]NEL56327.1 hypothetical protein [Goekera deserti]